MSKSWIIYILALKNNAFYTGITNNLDQRLEAHSAGKGSKYVRSQLPFRVVYIKEAEGRSDASRQEAAIKKLSRKDKEKLLHSRHDHEISLFCESCGVLITLRQDKHPEPEFDYQCVICHNIIHYKEESNESN